jgi:hypothetical protein
MKILKSSAIWSNMEFRKIKFLSVEMLPKIEITGLSLKSKTSRQKGQFVGSFPAVISWKLDKGENL